LLAKIFHSDASAARAIANPRAGLTQAGGTWKVSEIVRIDNITSKRFAVSVIDESNDCYFEPTIGRVLTAAFPLE
jgi:hypothetical protein